MRTTRQVTNIKSRSRALKHSIHQPVNLDRVAERLQRRNTESLRLRGSQNDTGAVAWLESINRRDEIVNAPNQLLGIDLLVRRPQETHLGTKGRPVQSCITVLCALI